MDKEIVPKEITLDDLYRLRASADLSRLTYSRTGVSKAPFMMFKKGFAANPVGYFGNEELVKTMCNLNNIVDFAIKQALETEKLKKEIGKFKKQSITLF